MIMITDDFIYKEKANYLVIINIIVWLSNL